jgi:hypothetical protein
VKRIPINEIPYQNDKELEKWVYDLYYEKDELLDKFYNCPDNDKKFVGKAKRNFPFYFHDCVTEPFKKMEEAQLQKKNK